MQQQSIILMLSIFYIYFLSDLFQVIESGASFQALFRLGLPLWGRLTLHLIDKIEKYNACFHEWWNQQISSPMLVTYIFKFIHWIHDNGIHLNWNIIMEYSINSFFVLILAKIFYNFIFIFNFSLFYLCLTLFCTYGVYMRFGSSRIALVTLTAKCIEMGIGIALSKQLQLIDDWKDYCIKDKKKDTWLAYTIKLLIGYYYNTDIDGEQMAIELGEYIGVSHIECKNLYEQSLIKKVSSIVELSKNTYLKFTI